MAATASPIGDTGISVPSFVRTATMSDAHGKGLLLERGEDHEKRGDQQNRGFHCLSALSLYNALSIMMAWSFGIPFGPKLLGALCHLSASLKGHKPGNGSGDARRLRKPDLTCSFSDSE
jgi:hypothetical protein